MGTPKGSSEMGSLPSSEHSDRNLQAIDNKAMHQIVGKDEDDDCPDMPLLTGEGTQRDNNLHQ